MKIMCWRLLLGWWLTVGLHAQVKIEVRMDQETYLAKEPLVVGVRIINFSGQKLELGQDSNWLQFILQSLRKDPVERSDEIPVQGEFTVESSETATRYLNLAPYYELAEDGRYQLTAIVRIKQWDQVLNSEPVSFNIVGGNKLWEQRFGVPRPVGSTEERPEVRKYTLNKLATLKEMRLYMRLTNADESRVYRVVPIGTMVSFSRPEAQLDKLSNLHVLYQSGARRFLYTVFDPDGQLILRHSHDYTNTRPVMRFNDQGEITIAGGIRIPTSTDLPPPPAPGTPTNAPSSKPPQY